MKFCHNLSLKRDCKIRKRDVYAWDLRILLQILKIPWYIFLNWVSLTKTKRFCQSNVSVLVFIISSVFVVSQKIAQKFPTVENKGNRFFFDSDVDWRSRKCLKANYFLCDLESDWMASDRPIHYYSNIHSHNRFKNILKPKNELEHLCRLSELNKNSKIEQISISNSSIRILNKIYLTNRLPKYLDKEYLWLKRKEMENGNYKLLKYENAIYNYIY